MAVSTCPKCSKSSFELKEHAPSGTKYKFSFIQCSSCGAVVGVTEYMNTYRTLETISNQLQQIIDKLP